MTLQKAAQQALETLESGALLCELTAASMLRVALADEQAQAVEPMPTAIRRNRTEQEFMFGMEVLNWNRAQTDPPIDVGRELWVADEVLKLPTFNDHPAPPPVSERMKVGDSNFESWYGETKIQQMGTKQRYREAYEAGLNEAQQVAVPAGWYHSDAQLAAIVGEIDQIQQTELKKQSALQKERVRVLRAECVALHYKRISMLAAAQGAKP